MKNTQGSTVVKMICLMIIILLSLSLTSFQINSQPTQNTKEVTLEIGETAFIPIPQNCKLSSINILHHQYKVINKTAPKMKFYPTNQHLNNKPNNRIYNKPLSYDIIKKGKEDIIRVHSPKEYYQDNKKYTTQSITIQIEYETTPISFFKASYEPQSPNYEYIIITNESFYPIFQEHFKDWKISTDSKITNVLIVNISTITSNSSYWVNGTYGDANASNPWIDTPISNNYSYFNDTQAHIRNFLRLCYENHNSRYVLLGGNKDVVPPRMIASYAVADCTLCEDWYNDTSHASDMYYSCLHYSMNNNTNSRFMENDCCGSPYDQIDWGYELCVGRVLVGSIEHLYNWINKTKAYVNGDSQGNYLRNHIVAAKNNAGSITNQSWYNLGGSFSASLNDEFPSNITFLNNQNITQAQWNNLDDYVNGNISPYDGFHIILHQGHGGSLYTPYQPSNNNNKNTPNFIYSEGCTSGDFGTDTSSRMEKWIRQNDSAFAIITNSAYGWFGASTYYVEEMMSQMFNDTTGNHTMIFAQAHNDAREIYGHDPDCVWGMIVKETNFAGDPSLEYNWYTAPERPEFISVENSGNGTTIKTSNPTFNWTTTSNTTQYNLQISNISDFSYLELNLSDINQYTYPSKCNINATRVSFTLPPSHSLTAYKKYYIRVRGHQLGGT